MNVVTPKGIFHLREAIPEDLHELVGVHVTSWNATYPGFHPKPTAALREQQWKAAFEERADNWFCYVAEKDNGGLAGFATGHDFHDPELPYEGQLAKIHFLPFYHRLGLGRRLMAMVAGRFLSRGTRSLILFADPANPNIAFYERLGGERLRDGQGLFQGAYGWTDLERLVDQCTRF